MKRTLSCLVVLALLFSLCACGSDLELPKKPTIPAVDTEYVEWNGLRFMVGIDMDESFHNDTYIDYEGKSISLRVVRSEIEAGSTTASKMVAQLSQDLIADGFACTTGETNYTPYVTAEKDDGFQICSYYIYKSSCWQIWGSLRNADQQDEKDRLLKFVTSGNIVDFSSAPDSPPDAPSTPEKTIELYVFVPDSWESPHCWAWDSATEKKVFSQWPGEPLTPGDDLYYLELPGWFDSFLISANDGTVQTDDLSVEPGKDIWVSIAEDGSIKRLNQE